jgi:hypothetical protein
MFGAQDDTLVDKTEIPCPCGAYILARFSLKNNFRATLQNWANKIAVRWGFKDHLTALQHCCG